jgi:sulfate adenylyltransferase
MPLRLRLVLGILWGLLGILWDFTQAALIASCTKTVELSDRNACDVELLSVGGFSPLKGFCTQEEYLSVVKNMALPVSTRT